MIKTAFSRDLESGELFSREKKAKTDQLHLYNAESIRGQLSFERARQRITVTKRMQHIRHDVVPVNDHRVDP